MNWIKLNYDEKGDIDYNHNIFPEYEERVLVFHKGVITISTYFGYGKFSAGNKPSHWCEITLPKE